MSINIQNLPAELKCKIFEELEFKDFISAMKVCKAWEKIIEDNFSSSRRNYENTHNLVIDTPRNLVIDKDISVSGELLIRAKNIYSKQTICLSGERVILVANTISYLSSIKAQQFKIYSKECHVVQPIAVAFLGVLDLVKSDFWSSLVNNNKKTAIRVQV